MSAAFGLSLAAISNLDLLDGLSPLTDAGDSSVSSRIRVRSDAELDQLMTSEQLHQIPRALHLLQHGQQAQKTAVIHQLITLVRAHADGDAEAAETDTARGGGRSSSSSSAGGPGVISPLDFLLNQLQQQLVTLEADAQSLAASSYAQLCRDHSALRLDLCDHVIGVLLPTILLMIDRDGDAVYEAVSRAWVEPLLAVLVVAPDAVCCELFEFIGGKLDAACSANSRLVCASVYGALSERVCSLQRIDRAAWLRHLRALCQDTAASVREEMARQLLPLMRVTMSKGSNAGSSDELHERVAHELDELLRDEESSVRCAAVQALADVMSIWTPRARWQRGLPWLRQLFAPSFASKDPHMYAAASKAFGQLWLPLLDDIGAASFSGASSPLGPASPSAAAASSSPFALSPATAAAIAATATVTAGTLQTANNGGEDGPQRLFQSSYRALVCSADAELRYYAAYNFPAVLSTFRERMRYMDQLQPSFARLYRDESDKVRTCIAAALLPVLRILEQIDTASLEGSALHSMGAAPYNGVTSTALASAGSYSTTSTSAGTANDSNSSNGGSGGSGGSHLTRLLVKHSREPLVCLLKDRCSAVSVCVVRQLPTCLSVYRCALDGTEWCALLQDVLRHVMWFVQQCVAAHAWRAKLAALETCVQLLPLYYAHADLAQALHERLLPVALAEMHSGASDVKSVCVQLIVHVLRHFPLAARRADLLARVIRDFALHRSSVHRCVFVDVAHACLLAFSPRWCKQQLIPLLLKLHTDKIRNVRARLVPLLPTVKRMCRLPADRSELDALNKILVALRGDSDEHVAEMAQRASVEMAQLDARADALLQSLQDYLLVEEERDFRARQEYEDAIIAREEDGMAGQGAALSTSVTAAGASMSQPAADSAMGASGAKKAQMSTGAGVRKKPGERRGSLTVQQSLSNGLAGTASGGSIVNGGISNSNSLQSGRSLSRNSSTAGLNSSAVGGSTSTGNGAATDSSSLLLTQKRPPGVASRSRLSSTAAASVIDFDDDDLGPQPKRSSLSGSGGNGGGSSVLNTRSVPSAMLNLLSGLTSNGGSNGSGSVSSPATNQKRPSISSGSATVALLARRQHANAASSRDPRSSADKQTHDLITALIKNTNPPPTTLWPIATAAATTRTPVMTNGHDPRGLSAEELLRKLSAPADDCGSSCSSSSSAARATSPGSAGAVAPAALSDSRIRTYSSGTSAAYAPSSGGGGSSSSGGSATFGGRSESPSAVQAAAAAVGARRFGSKLGSGSGVSSLGVGSGSGNSMLFASASPRKEENKLVLPRLGSGSSGGGSGSVGGGGGSNAGSAGSLVSSGSRIVGAPSRGSMSGSAPPPGAYGSIGRRKSQAL